MNPAWALPGGNSVHRCEPGVAFRSPASALDVLMSGTPGATKADPKPQSRHSVSRHQLTDKKSRHEGIQRRAVMSCKKVVSVLALAILAVVLVSAQTYTFNHADYATGVGPQTLAIGDFNGDGVKDIVTGNTNSSAHTVSVLLGKRDGTFEPNVDYAAGGAPSSVAVGDFNGDGKLDIIVVYGFENASVGVLLGNGDGTFKPVISTTAGPAGESIAVGDFNGDKKLDIAI